MGPQPASGRHWKGGPTGRGQDHTVGESGRGVQQLLVNATTTGSVVLWVTVELGGKDCPRALLLALVAVMIALAWDGCGGGESPSFD